ncbi:MAG: type VI secretion system tip protein VgrG [SAR324 cluster bacterium]|nr:type VI secretion system tip protein VgrG [SAR324 cluster bacterium]
MSEFSYTFACKAVKPDETLFVVSFKGVESLSTPYEYTIDLKSKSAEIDMEAMLHNPCTFTMKVGDSEAPVHGILSNFEQLHQVGEYTLYRAVLVPRLWQLSLHRANEIFLDMNIEDILKQVLEEGGLTSMDYEIQLNGSYPVWSFRCQYSETHLNYISRVMEHWGLYYYFVQEEDKEKLVITDNKQNHQKMPKPTLNFAASTGLATTYDNVQSLVCRQNRMPKKIILKDYNYEKPSVDDSGEATVDDKGEGELFVYGDNFDTPEEGKLLATVRAEEIRCTKEMFYGESHVARLVPGFIFELKKHFRSTFNQEYLVTQIQHEGSSPSHMAGDSSKVSYFNTFTAIPAATQYRAPRNTPIAKFYGNVNGRIDGELDGKYAEVDEQGRYKVIFLFDRTTERQKGKASWWVRMMQPYVGEKEGMHFPLRMGTEVLISFINGDTDQPVISGAIPNATHKSVVHGDNLTRNVLKTSSGNTIEFEDQEETNRIKLYTPQSQTYFHLGAGNFPGEGVAFFTQGLSRTEVLGGELETVVAKGYENEDAPIVAVQDDLEAEITQAEAAEQGKDLIDEQALFTFNILDDEGNGGTAMTTADELSGKWLVSRRAGDQYNWTAGNVYNYGGGNEFNFGGGYAETHMAQDINIGGETFTGWKWGGPNMDSDDVEKVWGNSWAYTKGNGYEYTEGNSYSYQKGDVDEEMDGNTKSVTTGDSEETIKGNNKSTHWGRNDEMFMGGKSEMNLSAEVTLNLSVTTELTLGAAAEIFIGVAYEAKIAASAEVYIGPKLEIMIGPKTEIEIEEISLKAGVNALLLRTTTLEAMKTAATATEVEATATTVQAEGTEVKAQGTEVKAQGTQVESKGTQINSVGTLIGAGGPQILAKALHLNV